MGRVSNTRWRACCKNELAVSSVRLEPDEGKQPLKGARDRIPPMSLVPESDNDAEGSRTDYLFQNRKLAAVDFQFSE